MPASYLPTAAPRETFTSDDLVARGFAATAAGGWLRISSAAYRARGRGRVRDGATIEQPSLIPGAEITEPITSSQLGLAVESEVDSRRRRGSASTADYASGDDAPGFGAFPEARRDRTDGRRVRWSAGESAARSHRRQLPLPSRLPRRSDPVPRDHRHRHRRDLHPAARARRRCSTVGSGHFELGRRADRVVGGRGNVDAERRARTRRRARSRAALREPRWLRGRRSLRRAASRRRVRQHRRSRPSPRRRSARGWGSCSDARARLSSSLAACGVNQTPQPEPAPTLPACVPEPRRRRSPPPSCRSRSARRSRTTRAPNRSVAHAAGTNGIWDLSEEHPTTTSSRSARSRSTRSGTRRVPGRPVRRRCRRRPRRHLSPGCIRRCGSTAPRRSDESAAARRSIRYAQPVAVLRFPIADGDAYDDDRADPRRRRRRPAVHRHRSRSPSTSPAKAASTCRTCGSRRSCACARSRRASRRAARRWSAGARRSSCSSASARSPAPRASTTRPNADFTTAA